MQSFFSFCNQKCSGLVERHCWVSYRVWCGRYDFQILIMTSPYSRSPMHRQRCRLVLILCFINILKHFQFSLINLFAWVGFYICLGQVLLREVQANRSAVQIKFLISWEEIAHLIQQQEIDLNKKSWQNLTKETRKQADNKREWLAREESESYHGFHPV